LTPVKIVVADDHDVVRAGVKTILQARPDWAICGEAADGQEAVDQVQKLHPDVVILDVSMPRLNGLEAAEKITQLQTDTRILIFTMHDSKSIARAAEKAGAQGLVIKSYAARDLIRALDVVLGGGSFFVPMM
jgi:DNA-binding NarL/FixJ family response regulator